MSNKLRNWLAMGSGASQVKTVNIDQTSDKYDRPRSSKEERERKHKIQETFKELEECKDELMTSKEQVRQYGAEIKQLEYLLSEAESTNHDLKDRVQVLEEEIDNLHKRQLLSTGGHHDFSDSLKLKDQYIKKLELETKAVQDEIKKLKNKHKKRIRVVSNQLAESKQVTTLKVFELKDEISKVSEEKTRLQECLERVRSAPPGSRRSKVKSNDSDQSEEENSGKTKVILELSQQVSQQDLEISKLEQKLVQKDKIIQGLLNKQKNTKLSQNDTVNHTPHDGIQECKYLASEINKTKRKSAGKRESDGTLTKASTADLRGSSGLSRDSGISFIE